MYEVTDFYEREDRDKVGFILALSHTYYEEIEKGFIKIWGEDKYLEHVYSYWKLKEPVSTLEITTKIGCSIQCSYCPQKVLISEYFKEDRKRDTFMTLEDFKLYLHHTPKDTCISFVGMCEPFLNNECIDMMEYASSQGYQMTVNTTLVGVTTEIAARLKKIKFKQFNFHAPDEDGMMRVTLNEEYYQVVKLLEPMFTDVMIFGDLKKELTAYLKGRRLVEGKLIDRAGNLDNIDHIKELCGGVRCVHTAHRFNQNILLPDGSVVLCCNDYGLSHILGNLKQMDLEQIRLAAMEKVLEEADGNGDFICRHCTYAMEKDKYEKWIARK